jgi:outer membrane protein
MIIIKVLRTKKMHQKKYQAKNKQQLVVKLPIYLFSLLLTTPILMSNTFAAESTMQLDKTLRSQTTADAEALLRKNDFKAAYQLLEPLEADRAGDVEYDYLLGVAGVESGNLTRGAFALERVLAVNPNHQDARAEMAKAHYLLGEKDAANAEFNNVLAQNPDVQTKKVIEKLLTAIQKAEGTTTTFSAYLDFGLGWDSNVSSAPDLQTIGVPLFGGPVIDIDLGTTGLAKSDHFMGLAGGISFRQPINEKLAVFGGVSGTNRLNGNEIAFDNSALDLNAGLQYKQNEHSFTAALQDNHFDLNSEGFRHAYGATGQWIYNVDSNNQAGLYAQYSRLNYTGSHDRNADRKIIGLNAGHVFKGDSTPVIFGSIYGGREEARNAKRQDLSQDVVGFRTGGQVSLASKWQLLASMGVEMRENDVKDTLFLKKRKDYQYDGSVGINFIPAQDWSIKPQLTYSKNDSNIDTDSYDRTIFSVNVRKDFNW